MKWIIEYIDGKSISEDEVNFKFINKDNVRLLYFLDNEDNKYGVNLLNLTFFSNRKIYDFKITGQYEITQFKSANVSWGETLVQNITSWNLGVKNDNESYILSITPNKEVYMLASKDSYSKTIRLQ